MLSVGEILRKEREKQGLTLKEVERAIRVRRKFLEDIENNYWNDLSSRIYVEGIIKNYAKFLKVDTQKALAFFRRDYGKKEEIRFNKRISHKYLTFHRHFIKAFGVILLIVLFSLYFAYQVKVYLSPPKLEVISPKVSAFKKEDKITVIGKTEKEAAVTIFGERIYTDSRGVFEYQFPLKKGKNTLKIEVTGANGRKTVLIKNFYNE